MERCSIASMRTVPPHHCVVIAHHDPVADEDGHGDDGDDQPAFPRPLVGGAVAEVIWWTLPAVEQGDDRRHLEAKKDQWPRHITKRSTHCSLVSDGGFSFSRFGSITRASNVP